MLSLIAFYIRVLAVLDRLAPLMLLAVRLWVGHLFWVSGVLKISDWDNTLTLFTYEYPVPFLPPTLAAIFGTTFELLCPVLLALGLASRLAALPLIVMTAVINFTYQEAVEHYHWAMLLGVILFCGPGKFSIDHWIKRRFTHLF